MSTKIARYCINHLESRAQFYCPNCKQFLCEACVEDKFADDDFFEACKKCGMRCVEARGIRPPNIEIRSTTSISNSFVRLIFHPVETIDSAVVNSSYSFLLVRLLPIYAISLLLVAGSDYTRFSASTLDRLLQPILFWITLAAVISLFCRIHRNFVVTVLSSADEEKITGFADIVELTLALIYVHSLANLSSFLLSFLPSNLIANLLSYGVGIGVYVILAMFVREIYDLDFRYALIFILVAARILTAVYVSFFLFRMLGTLGPFGR